MGIPSFSLGCFQYTLEMSHILGPDQKRKEQSHELDNSVSGGQGGLNAGKTDVAVDGKHCQRMRRTLRLRLSPVVAPDVRTAQELARHETANLTLNTYGRAKEERCCAVVESVGNLVFNDGLRDAVDTSGQQNCTKFAQGFELLAQLKVATPDNVGGCDNNGLVRKRGLETAANDFDTSDADVQNMEISGQNVSQCGQNQEVKTGDQICERTETDVCRTPDVISRNTRIAQVLHKDRTRDLLESQIAIPHDLYQLLTAWPILSTTAKNAIMEAVKIGTHESDSQQAQQCIIQ